MLSRFVNGFVLGLFLAGAFMLVAVDSHAATKVFVTILPQKYFVERIAGDLVDVGVLVLPGANPHMYEPSPKQMSELAGAKGYLAIGVALEDSWLPRVSAANRDLRVFRTQEGVKKIPMAEYGHEDHGHDDHDHGTLDPHIWLDPIRAKAIARNTCKALIEIDPASATVFEANLKELLKDVEDTHTAIKAMLTAVPAARRTFMVFHPSWGYFAHRYGLTQMPIEAGGNEPGPRHLTEIIKHAREDNIRVIFTQPQFSMRSAKVIAAELDAQVVPLDPLAENWKENLLHAAEAFVESVN